MGSFFKGGVHPPERKELTEDKSPERLEPGPELVFPVSQHLGAPCKPLVKKGDRVLVGQRIADSEAFVSAPIHSSVSGTVKDVALRQVPSGELVLSVVVENDGLYEPDPSMRPRDPRGLSPDEIRRAIREAGVVGMGGACFPTHVKLTPPPDKRIDFVILNGAECEPYLTCDDLLMRTEGDRVIEGLKLVLALFPQASGLVGIEENKPRALRAMGEWASSLGEGRISVFPLRTRYPQGAEKMLIYALTGREVPAGGLPADVGCVVLNVRTAYQIWDALFNGRPVIERIVTVAGDAVGEPKNLLVRIGTPIRELVEACGGFAREPRKLIAGGPMMGIALSSLDVPVVKGTSGVLALSEGAAFWGEQEECIRCGRCVEACPVGLLPYELNAYVLARRYDDFGALGGVNCIECGCCSYVCPAKRHLTQSMRDGKRTLASRRR